MAGLDENAPQSLAETAQDHGLPGFTPDAVEQEEADQIDDVVPTRGYGKAPVVGLGGSAGGLQPLQAFFSAMPPESGMAFVVIMHLSAEHESILAELLQRSTTMPVEQVRDGTKVLPNHVYVIPPAKDLSLSDSILHLSDPTRQRGAKHVAVDLFFRTLADTHGAHAAAIVLSGADGDGAIGIKRIKERGGLTVAQDPTEAEHDSMPRAAVVTGMVDWVLPAAEMPARLIEYWCTERQLRLPPEDGPPPAEPRERGRDFGDGQEATLHDILGFLRARTGRDFIYYKRATILRRIGRRMQVNGIVEPGEYLAFLRTHPGEAGALLQDLLISVTNFFRDRDSFAALEKCIPKLFRGKGPNDTVRVWIAACATGEEAYSVAIMLLEHAAMLDHAPSIQVFATDLDENAIRAAREGVYQETITADVSEERLRRFFSRVHGHFKVKPEVREAVLFALHDLLKDSPFSRLDMVTCRNLLIYLNRDAQARVTEIFDFALKPEGILFLGASESLEEDDALFTVLDKKHRLYARRGQSRFRPLSLAAGASAQTQALIEHYAGGPVVPQAPQVLHRPLPIVAPVPPPQGAEGPASWGEVHSRALDRFGPSSVLVSQEHEIVHLSGQVSRFLQLITGEPTNNLMRLVHPMLRVELRAALFRAVQSRQPVETHGVPVEIEGSRAAADLRVIPDLEMAPGFLLVIFTERDAGDATQPAAAPGEEQDAALGHLERELEHLKTRLRETVEQSEASQEESKAANEELQAMNEELRSASEELETGREELHSINEELSTVNQELKGKIEELRRSNSDLQNLMSATQIATVFLDRSLCIQRYTPPAVALFRLIPADIGRPLSDLTSRLNYPDLAADAERTLESLTVNETEVGHHDGRCFLARMLPYRTEQDRIAGVVLTFVDITERNRAETDLRESEERLRVTTDSIPQIVWRMDAAGRFEFFNRQWESYTGAACEPATLAELASQFVHPDDEAATLEAFAAAQRESGPFLVEHRLRSASGEYCWFLVRAEPHRDPENERTLQWFGTSTDIGERKRGEVALRTTADRLQLALATARLGTWDRNLETGEVIWSPQFTTMYGLPQERESGTYEEWLEHIYPDDREAVAAEVRAAIAEHRDIMIELRSAPGDGARWTIAHGRVIYDESGKAVRLIGVAGDITSRKEAEAALRQSEERYRRVVNSVADYAIFTLDPGGSITSWNPGAERIKGYTAEEIIGRNIVLFYTPEQLAAGQPARELAAAASRGSCQIEDWRVRKDGSRIWEDDLIVPLHGGDGESLLGYAKICRDLSARKVAEDERARLLAAAQAARREAEAANRAKDQFLAVLSHEMRAPLAPVQMALFALKLEKRLSARGRESLDMIERNVESETRLIDDLLDVSRIVHGKFDLMLAPMDLHACILRAVEVCEGDLAAKRLHLNQSLGAIYSHFQGDAARLQQVFWNLLKNAAKFTPQGGTITLLSIDITARDGSHGICVEVTDTGIGIPPESLPKLFDAFEQGGPDVVRVYGGLGLGLAISNAIVQAHGGQMRAESRGRDQGATFAVRLPNTTCAGAEEKAF